MRTTLLALLLTMVSVLPLEARESGNAEIRDRAATEQEVLRDLERILDLWRDARYDDLFERTGAGKDGKELFAKKLASAPRKPACCWEKIQDARVSLDKGGAAAVHARLGFEGGISGTEFVTRGIKLKKRGDFWAISQSDLFSLAKFSKKRAVYKYLPIQPK